ncbi:DUF4175 domain-containing protein [Terricaulis sp.]|uniref:DUF4175 domain-containing protein n=1 Tax=Terricaulis sp. TaxID=2768686 RepID=UPI003784CD2A
MKHQDALNQLARETERARKSLMLERALGVGFWLAFAVGAWAAFALVGGHAMLPLLLQSLTVIGALCAFGWLAWRGRKAWRTPSEAEARARLAADSHLDAGAFEALRDRPSRYDVFAVALWKREQEQAYQRVEKARARGAQVQLDHVDRYKARYVLLALLALGFVVARGDSVDRLARAFLPDPGPLLGDQEMQVEAWVTPAEYTHAAPISLSDRLGQRVETPPSVEATVRVTGPTGAPVLVFDGSGEHRPARFTRAADGAWEARLEIPGAGRLKIVRFHTRGAWRIAPAPDARPAARFTAPIAFLPDERATIAWQASDDFGVRHLVLRVTPVNPPAGLAHAAPIDTEIQAPAGDPREAEGQSELELADHPYAGMEVEARIVAIDALGQEGASDALRVTLPEKVFLQPLARAAIEIRRHILSDRRPYRPAPRERVRTMNSGDTLLGNDRIEVRDYDRNPPLRRAPEGVRRGARLLDALMMAPEDGYFRDLAVYLGFRYARSELAAAEDIDATKIAADILWRTALRAEYGGAADTRVAMEEAQRALAEALRNGAPPERVRQLVEALRRATERYMQALVQEALRNGERENMEDTEEQTSISGRDIQEMLEEVQRLAEQGRTEEAQALLQMLAGIMANLDARLEQSESGQGEQGDQQQMQQGMDQLNQTLGEQRALRDDTQQRQEQQQQNGQGGGGGEQQGGQGGQDLADRQAQLQQGLQAARRMAEESGAAPSDDLDAAGQAMRQAENALRRGDLEGAEAAQNAALEHLREGAEAMAAEMRENGRQGQRQEGNSGARDPLGRMLQGGGVGEGDTQVPTQADPVRAREILEEIRRRAQDPNRPEAEREYLRRLLDRFSDGGT